MITIKCECGKEIEAYTQKQADYMMKRHQLMSRKHYRNDV